MPSRAKSFPVSVLPIPIEPVSPIIKGFRWRESDTRKGSHEAFAQLGGDFGRHAEPGCKSWHSLMHEHAEPIQRPVTARTSSFEQCRFQRIVDDVGNRRL